MTHRTACAALGAFTLAAMLAACSQAEDDARAEAPATTAQAETSAPAVAVASARDGEAPPLSAYVGKHPTDDEALALPRFGTNDRSGGSGDAGGIVAAVVVVDIDACLGQRCAKIADDLADGRRLIVAGQENGDVEVGGGLTAHGGPAGYWRTGSLRAASDFTIS